MKNSKIIILLLGLGFQSCVKWDLEKFPLNTFSRHYPMSPAIDTQLTHQFVQITDGSFRIIGTNIKQQINLLQVTPDGKTAISDASLGQGIGNDIQNGSGQNAFGTLLQSKEGVQFLQFSNGISPTIQTMISNDLTKKFPLIEKATGLQCHINTNGNWLIVGVIKQFTQDNRLYINAIKPGGIAEWIHTYDTHIDPKGGYLTQDGTLFVLGSRPGGNAILLRFDKNGILTLSKPLPSIFIANEAGISGNGKSIFVTAAQKTLKGYKTCVTSLNFNGEREWDFTKESSYGLSTGLKIISEKEGQLIVLEREGVVNAGLTYNHKLIRLNAAGELLWENSFPPEKPNEKLVDLLVSNDFGYVLLGTEISGYKLIKTDVFGKINP
jgi:hypothetical protein